MGGADKTGVTSPVLKRGLGPQLPRQPGHGLHKQGQGQSWNKGSGMKGNWKDVSPLPPAHLCLCSCCFLLPACLGTWTHPLGSCYLPALPPLNLGSSHRKIRGGHPGGLPRGGEPWKSVSNEAVTSEVRYHLWGLSPACLWPRELIVVLKQPALCTEMNGLRQEQCYSCSGRWRIGATRGAR